MISMLTRVFSQKMPIGLVHTALHGLHRWPRLEMGSILAMPFQAPLQATLTGKDFFKTNTYPADNRAVRPIARALPAPYTLPVGTPFLLPLVPPFMRPFGVRAIAMRLFPACMGLRCAPRTMGYAPFPLCRGLFMRPIPSSSQIVSIRSDNKGSCESKMEMQIPRTIYEQFKKRIGNGNPIEDHELHAYQRLPKLSGNIVVAGEEKIQQWKVFGESLLKRAREKKDKPWLKGFYSVMNLLPRVLTKYDWKIAKDIALDVGNVINPSVS